MSSAKRPFNTVVKKQSEEESHFILDANYQSSVSYKAENSFIMLRSPHCVHWDFKTDPTMFALDCVIMQCSHRLFGCAVSGHYVKLIPQRSAQWLKGLTGL